MLTVLSEQIAGTKYNRPSIAMTFSPAVVVMDTGSISARFEPRVTGT